MHFFAQRHFFLFFSIKEFFLIIMQGVIVLDPDLSKDYLDLIQNRTKEKRYSFDHAFGPECTNTVCKQFSHECPKSLSHIFLWTFDFGKQENECYYGLNYQFSGSMQFQILF